VLKALLQLLADEDGPGLAAIKDRFLP